MREGSSAADVPSAKDTSGWLKNEKLATITIAPSMARVFFMSECREYVVQLLEEQFEKC